MKVDWYLKALYAQGILNYPKITSKEKKNKPEKNPENNTPFMETESFVYVGPRCNLTLTLSVSFFLSH